MRTPGLTRRELLRDAALLSVGASPLAALLSGCGGGTADKSAAAARPFTPTFYNWITSLHPAIEQSVNPDFAKNCPLDSKIAPVQGFGIDRFVTEAREKSSSWDVYVGMTPFVEMAALIDAGVIEPWDAYIPKDVLEDIIPSVRAEGTVGGKLYGWPFLLDVTLQGWNASLVEKAGLDPAKAPRTWDEYLANAKKVVDSKAAPFGCTFDAHGWRSLAPIAHSIDTRVYTPDGLFDFTHDAAVQALELMRRMKELANPNVLNPGATDGGVNDTPDEGVFAGRQAAYYIKYQNAPRRCANTWPDPAKLQLAGLPKTENGGGGTVFWATGAALFRYGQNKPQAAQYMKALTYDERVWRHSVSGREGSGHLPIYRSTWNSWKEKPPEWMKNWAFLVREQLDSSQAIRTHKFGLAQFNLGQPHWEKYLKGEEPDAKKAMQQARDAVQAEVQKSAKKPG